jgi:glycosyltransferase involved in cell wall biosynthesis
MQAFVILDVHMRIAIIGPSHPYKGGIAQHTTELAHHLSAAGHEVELISWRTQYPFFYPGQQFVVEPELPQHPGTRRVLSWRDPVGWARWGRRLRAFDRIILVWWVPTIQGPVYLGMLGALGRKRPPVTIICHNVLPHEPRPGDKKLARAVLSRCQQIIVHSADQAKLAAKLTDKLVRTVDLPLPLLQEAKKAPKKGISNQLLFFGFVRPYKGVDVLLRALATIPNIQLTIAGEIWGDFKVYTDLVDKLGLQDRVRIKNGYVPANELATLITEADAVVLPYKAGTGSWNVSMAHAYGAPVIATSVGSHETQIQNDIDGLLCEPDNISSLAGVIKHFYEPGVAKRLREAVPEVSSDTDWQRYVKAVTAD